MHYVASYFKAHFPSILQSEKAIVLGLILLPWIWLVTVKKISLLNLANFFSSSDVADDIDDRDLPMVEQILSRSVDISPASIPHGWSNDWYQWAFCHALDAVYDTSRLEIYLTVKYSLHFKDVKLLMYKRYTEQLVFQYRQRFYRYMMRFSDLSVYPGDYESVDDFFERREEDDEKRVPVDAVGTDAECLRLNKAQFILDYNA
ncbi:hypothetical protein C8J56DRAFT_1165244 [Mycena floridula]|nr:hypothetical protein C8J56DRAFT_1165244 [Mycena floridula]